MNVNYHNTNYFQHKNAFAFAGKTKCFALTDSHQETRKECAFLSKILEEAKKNDNVLVLNCGDILKGIYPKDLEIESYLELKKQAPNIEIVMTLGNNDFGFDKKGVEYLKKSVKAFDNAGIKVVSANIFDKETNKRPDWIKPYTTLERDGDKIFVTGFCVDSINKTGCGMQAKPPKDIFEELKKNIDKEKPDAIVILNHDWYANSPELIKYAKSKGIKVDLLIGGHEHDAFKPIEDLRIYYPQAFNNSMYNFDLVINNKNQTEIKNMQEIMNRNIPISEVFEKKLAAAEEKTGLMQEIAPVVLDLPKEYSETSPLGSFLCDAMKAETGSEIAFFSTGFLMAPMRYEEGKKITVYDLKKTMMAESEVKKVKLNADQLKEIFDNAVNARVISREAKKGNAKFLQCSSNMKIEVAKNENDGTCSVKQIYIDDEPILDTQSGKALNPNKEFPCAIDSFIAEGGQDFTTLKAASKADIAQPTNCLTIDKIFINALTNAPHKYEKGSIYPKAEIVDLC